MILNKETAREAAQEVWYELCKSISSFKGDSEISTGYTLSLVALLVDMQHVKSM
jgi:hypothetical protein